jgi:hypothetical protein
MIDDEEPDADGQCMSRARCRSLSSDFRGMVNSFWQQEQLTQMCVLSMSSRSTSSFTSLRGPS